jgi:hypothetical protein
MLSTLVFPFVGLALRQRSQQEGEPGPPADGPSPVQEGPSGQARLAEG